MYEFILMCLGIGVYLIIGFYIKTYKEYKIQKKYKRLSISDIDVVIAAKGITKA